MSKMKDTMEPEALDPPGSAPAVQPAHPRGPLMITVGVDPQNGRISLAISINAVSDQDLATLMEALQVAQRQLMDARLQAAKSQGSGSNGLGEEA